MLQNELDKLFGTGYKVANKGKAFIKKATNKGISGYRQMIIDQTPKNTANQIKKISDTMIDDLVYNMKTSKQNKLASPQTLRNIEQAKATQKALGAIGKASKVASKVATNYLPITSDIYDIYSGGKKIYNADNWKQALVGAGQMGLGLAGLATLGTGSLAKVALKAGANSALKHGAMKELLRRGVSPESIRALATIRNIPYNSAKVLSNVATSANRFMNNPVTAIGAPVVSELLYKLSGNNNNDYIPTNNNEQEIPVDDVNQEMFTNSVSDTADYEYNSGGGHTGSGYPGGIDSVGSMINGLTNGGNGYNSGAQQPTTKQVNQQNQQVNNNLSDMYQILNNWKDQQEYMKPYREGLNRYINEFDDRYNQSFARDRWIAGMADLGVPSMKNLIGKYTPLEQGAKKLDLQKLQGQELQSVDQGANELIAGMKLAEQAGLDPSVVLANPTIMKEILGQMQLDKTLDTKMAISEEANRIKMQMNYLNNQIEIAKHNGKQAQAYALEQQKMRLQSQLKTMQIMFDSDNPDAVADYANSNLGIKVNVPKNIGTSGADAIASKYKGL